MKEEIKTRAATFSPQELDLIGCALIRYLSELRARSRLMERFGAPQHMEKHRAKIALGEKLLEEFGS